ncbi:MAG: ribosomal protein S18-alanine N-acetyltransferase [Bryobacteraceae bacterium]|jgi:ribosomal-protein-alanine N-acetyltransferase
MSLVRPGAAPDLEHVAAIQAASPEAAQWPAEDYLGLDFRVCILDDRIAGFAVSRITGPDERELLNLAVAPEFRRRGVGAALMRSLITGTAISVFLEVRESNLGARVFYKTLGFQEVGLRPEYYASPSESAIVMKFHSC